MNEFEKLTDKTILQIIVPKDGSIIDNSIITISVIEELGERYVMIEDSDDESWQFPVNNKDQWLRINFAVIAALKLCKD
jgi:hypothetical protein